jgi:hypothetical protein
VPAGKYLTDISKRGTAFLFSVSTLRIELKKEALIPSDSSVTIYHYTWHSTPQDFNLQVLNLGNAIHCSKVKNNRVSVKHLSFQIILNLSCSL